MYQLPIDANNDMPKLNGLLVRRTWCLRSCVLWNAESFSVNKLLLEAKAPGGTVVHEEPKRGILDDWPKSYLCRELSPGTTMDIVTFFYECEVDAPIIKAERYVVSKLLETRSLPPALTACLPRWLVISCDVLGSRKGTYLPATCWSFHQGSDSMSVVLSSRDPDCFIIVQHIKDSKYYHVYSIPSLLRDSRASSIDEASSPRPMTVKDCNTLVAEFSTACNLIHSDIDVPFTLLLEVDLRKGVHNEVQYDLIYPDKWLLTAVPLFGFTTFFFSNSITAQLVTGMSLHSVANT